MAYLLKVDGTMEYMGQNPPLKLLQKAVGGWIEPVMMANGDIMYCNEEGKIMGLPPNPAANKLISFAYDYIVGDVVVMSDDMPPNPTNENLLKTGDDE